MRVDEIVEYVVRMMGMVLQTVDIDVILLYTTEEVATTDVEVLVEVTASEGQLGSVSAFTQVVTYRHESS